jgi:hypothetical protein
MGQKRTLGEERKENARRLATLTGYSAAELWALMTPKRGRPPDSGRVKPEETDKYLYVVGFQERIHGTDPKVTLKELLGKSTHPDHNKILKRYRDRPERYRDVILALHETKRGLSVVPAPVAHLPARMFAPLNPDLLCFDADEPPKQEP